MPQISLFFGIIIRMYFDDHNPPHFHAAYGDFEAIIDIEKNELISDINDRLSGFGVNQFEFGSKWDTQYHIAEIKKYE